VVSNAGADTRCEHLASLRLPGGTITGAREVAADPSIAPQASVNFYTRALAATTPPREAPTRIVASKITGGKVERTRPLCPYPQVARYTGSGSIDDAENFVCQTP
jgi:hypothetical protein